MDWREESVRATFALLVASLALVGPGLAGVGSSLALVIAVLALAGVSFWLRDRLTGGPTLIDREIGAYWRVLWVGPALGAAVCLAFLGATPAELQALGGLVGLVGMANYFLRPVYRAGSMLRRRVTDTR